MSAQPLLIESVADRVYAVLRRRILDGALAGGDKLRQEALAEELGVSRTPLREALRRLAAEGLVELTVNRGAQVVDVGPGEVRAAYEARLVLEPGAARLAAIRRPAELLAAMRAAVELQRADPTAGYQASRNFHLALVEASTNDYLIRTAEALWVPGFAHAVYERQGIDAEIGARDLAEHERILDAVSAGDPDLAEALTRSHVEGALRLLLAD